jgi:hypothetical protein
MKAWQGALEGVFKDVSFIASTRKLGFKSNYQTDSAKITDFFKKEVDKYSRFTPAELGWK